MEPFFLQGEQSVNHNIGLILPVLVELGYSPTSHIVDVINEWFPPTTVSSGNSVRDIAFTNQQNSNVWVTSLTISGFHANQFSVTTTSQFLGQYEGASIPVTFSPDSFGYKEATLNVTYLRAGEAFATTNTIKLIGIGLGPDDDGDRMQNMDENLHPSFLSSTQSNFSGDNGSNSADSREDGWNDYDEDGINNYTEFLFGYNPTVDDPFAEFTDDDTDGDGIPNVYEDFGVDWDHLTSGTQQLDPFWNDNMGSYPSIAPNGIQDGLDDWDADGIANWRDGFTDDDYPVGDGLLAYEDYDSDGDGIDDSEEGIYTWDADGDGEPNHLDDDSDGDHILDMNEGTGNLDGDGLPNFLDLDSDDDGYTDLTEYNHNSDPYDVYDNPEPLPVSGAMRPFYFFANLALCLAFSGAVVLRRRS